MNTDQIIAAVREGRRRSFTCRSCGAETSILVQLTGSRGRFPAHCESCNPNAPTYVRERQERPLRAAILVLDERVRQLGSQATHVDLPRDGRAYRYGEPGREAFGKAVRKVVTARGAAGTREALLDAAAAARVWATLLGARGER